MGFKLFGGEKFTTRNLYTVIKENKSKYKVVLANGVVACALLSNGKALTMQVVDEIRDAVGGKSRKEYARYMSENYDWDYGKALTFTYAHEIFQKDKDDGYTLAKQWISNAKGASKSFMASKFHNFAYDPTAKKTTSEESSSETSSYKTEQESSDAGAGGDFESAESDEFSESDKPKAPTPPKATSKKPKTKIFKSPKKKSPFKKPFLQRPPMERQLSDRSLQALEKQGEGWAIGLYRKDSRKPKTMKILKRNADGSVVVQFQGEADTPTIPANQILKDNGGIHKSSKLISSGKAKMPESKATTSTAASATKNKNALDMNLATWKNLYVTADVNEADAEKEYYELRNKQARWVQRKFIDDDGDEIDYYHYSQPSLNPMAPSGNRAIKLKNPLGKERGGTWVDPDGYANVVPKSSYKEPSASASGGGGKRSVPIVASWDGNYVAPTDYTVRTRGVGTDKGGVRGQVQSGKVPSSASQPPPAGATPPGPTNLGGGLAGGGAPPPPGGGGGGGPQPPPGPPPGTPPARGTANALGVIAGLGGRFRQRQSNRRYNRRLADSAQNQQRLEDQQNPTRTITPGEVYDRGEPTDRDANVKLQVSEQEKRLQTLTAEGEAIEQAEGEKDLTDNKPEISTTGHQKAVSLIAVRYGRDFTYYKNLVQEGVLQPPPTDYSTRKKAMDDCLAEYGPLFEIESFNTDYTYEEAVEIYALKAIYKEVLDEERAWKRALIKMGQRMGLDPNYDTGPPGQLQPGMVIPFDGLGIRPQDLIDTQNRSIRVTPTGIPAAGPPPSGPPPSPTGGETKSQTFSDDDSASQASLGGAAGGAAAAATVGQPASQSSQQTINKQNELTKKERKELNKFRFNAKQQPKTTSSRVRKPKELDPEKLKFNTHTRMNPNLLMQLGRVGFPTNNNQRGAPPSFSRIQKRSAPTRRLNFKIF